jgi:hypothetical protein
VLAILTEMIDDSESPPSPASDPPTPT